jgi:hypothetical protein
MKKTTNLISRLSLVAIACAFVTSTPINGQVGNTDSGRVTSGEMARLVVNRSANFGRNETVGLFVDGTRVANLVYGQNYDAPLAPGKHLVSIHTDPEVFPEGTLKQIPITAEPGKTYTFTAVWPDRERAGLIEG